MERRKPFCRAVAIYALILALGTITQAQYAGGTGTPEDPYLITTPEQMNAIGADPNDWDKHFKLMADIDLSAYTGTEFNLIGYHESYTRRDKSPERTPFAGVFDGNGHAISNFSYTCEDNYVGLFKYIGDPNAEIRNLGLSAPTVDGGTGNFVGGLVGYLEDGTIRNCYVEGGTVVGNSEVGGLAGDNGGLVTGCYANTIVAGDDDIGGLIGDNSGSISNSYSTGQINGGGRAVGGLVGCNSGGVSDCYSTGEVTADTTGVEGRRRDFTSAGGLIGSNGGSVWNCHSNGQVTGKDYAGGLVGQNSGIVSYCWSTGLATGNDCVGGLVGKNSDTVLCSYSTGEVAGNNGIAGLIGLNSGSVSNCYSTGATTGNRYVAGLIGYNSGSVSTCYSTGPVTGNEDVDALVGGNDGSVVSSFWNTETSGLTISVWGVGLTTAGMQDKDTYLDAGWDFVGERVGGTAEVWQMPQIGGYPALSVFEGYEPVLPEGQGTITEPFLVTNALELGSIAYRPLASYRLGADIDLVGITWTAAVIPWFDGQFDGNGHAIRHLHIQGGGVLGLFGCLKQHSVIADVGLEDSSLRGTGRLVGLLAGHSRATLLNCYSTGVVTGDDNVGGLIGGNYYGSISNCSSTGAVTGADNVGGLVGRVYHSSVSNCSSTAGVTGKDYVGGLLGYNSDDGSVSDCFSSGGVTGNDRVGGLVGDNSGSLSNCSSTGEVTGDYRIGGLVGNNSTTASVSDCYSTGAVTGERWDVGGLVGFNSGRVSNCYGTGEVKGIVGRRCIGGLVGYNYISGSISSCYSTGAVTGDDGVGGLVGDNRGRVVDSFWDIESSGVAYSSAGAGLTTAEMMDPEWIGLQGWANDPNWILDPYQDYPRLAWEGTAGQVVPEPIIDWIVGQGTSEMPYEIDDPDQLLMIGKASLLWDKNIVLMGNLDLTNSLCGQAVIPDFTGAFDGNSHVIKHLRVSGDSHLGLFGRLAAGGTILNLGLLDVDIAGTGDHVGGLAGENDGSVSNCYSTGEVTGNDYVGGLVGDNHGSVSNGYSTGVVTGDDYIGGLVGNACGSVSNGYSTGAVTGDNYIGGLVGNNHGSVSNGYSTGEVTGNGCVGGLVGRNSDSVSYSYSAGAVTGDDYVGGLVGYSDDGNVVSSFWDIVTSGQTTSAGGTGLTTNQMQTAAPFLEAGWDFVGEAENGTEEIWWIDEGRDYPRLWWESDGAEF